MINKCHDCDTPPIKQSQMLLVSIKWGLVHKMDEALKIQSPCNFPHSF